MGIDTSRMDDIESTLVILFGDKAGKDRTAYIQAKLDTLPEDQSTAPLDPYGRLDGKVFAICYPDNIHDGAEPTLQTLERVLTHQFPHIGGIHILPERTMSHDDLWPQDLLSSMSPEHALSTVDLLEKEGILDKNRRLTESYGKKRNSLMEQFGDEVVAKLDAVYNSHFNDGGFSQKTRKSIDPRFGDIEDISRITKRFQVMLDFVVNHLDIDNDALHAFRRGEADGSEFIIISPQTYADLQADGTLSQTFRPRPFPLFTGLRKYPLHEWTGGPNAEMCRRMEEAGLPAPDDSVISLFSVAFKISNDQGFTAEDTRIFKAFILYLESRNIDPDALFTDSSIQPQQKTFSKDILAIADALSVDRSVITFFGEHDDEVFGTKFFVYTTFSESQADVNPISDAGFKMVIDDLFELLQSGTPAMLRMDAIKYLWKEIGKKNFDMEEGNSLINVIRSVMHCAAPQALPLDEINSPDPVVYTMMNTGGFAYIFGQVNAVPAAFNAGNLQPITKFRTLMDRKMPKGLVPFVMLSTHDGRSVQGLGVDRTDGHVSIAEFRDLVKVVEERGGKPKFRSVAPRRIPLDTFTKVLGEAKLSSNVIETLFANPTPATGSTLVLKDDIADRKAFLAVLEQSSGMSGQDLAGIPAIDFALQWIFDGLTPYELCSTSRDAFSATGSDGAVLSPEMEARRLAVAQLYVLTLTQAVPAIYFNDLLGIGNDFAGYSASGRPRDLNRKRVALKESGLEGSADPFTSSYVPLINRYIELRSQDQSFYPGADSFEYRELSPVVFLNHAYARDDHAYVVGNISDLQVDVTLKVSEPVTDIISGTGYQIQESNGMKLTLEPFGALWLKPTAGLS